MRLFYLPLVLLLLSPALGAVNLTEEQRLSEQLDTPALDGEAQWIEANNQRFLAVFKKTNAPRHLGGAILLHDLGDHADARLVIGPLRLELARRGWDTLSLQLPRPLEPLSPEGHAEAVALGVQRVQAAMDWFKNRQTRPLVLVGHGLGAETALAWLSGKPSPEAGALVAIGLAAGDGSENDPVIQAIARVQRPVLDLYGERDRPEVAATAQARRASAAGARQSGYRQDRVMGADHGFSGLQESLRQRVASWLRRIALSEARHPTP